MAKNKVGKINSVKAAGNNVLVEMLTNQEIADTELYISDEAELSTQGYIIDIGPLVEGEKWGLKVGDRVLLQGKYVPVPYSSTGRQVALTTPHDIKCVFNESHILSN